MGDTDGAVWPRPRFRLFPIMFSRAQSIENYLEKNFTLGYPVLFSSGRNAISTVLRTFYKSDLVHLFPYASQCVVQSVLHANLIAVTPLNTSILDISYNQWGRLNTKIKVSPFIEDSIDSLYPIGAKILRSGADFEVWSLSKIFALNFGAIMWCRDANQANILREIRYQNKNTKLSILRCFLSIIKSLNPRFHQIWEKIEFRNLPLLSIEYGVISNNVAKWEDFYNSRLMEYKSVLSQLPYNTLQFLLEDEKVIPVVIDLPSGFNLDCSRPIKRLHRISGINKIDKVNVIAYQEGI